jgi:N6-L-threonylcarbamoyladenine synthase
MLRLLPLAVLLASVPVAAAQGSSAEIIERLTTHWQSLEESLSGEVVIEPELVEFDEDGYYVVELEGDPSFLDLPSPRLGPKGRRGDALFDLSFSGIKTAVRYWIADLGDDQRASVLEAHRADIAASFQRTVVDALVEGVRQAVRETGVRAIAVVGGVSANSGLRRAVLEAGERDGFETFVPDLAHSVDNAAMIAVTAAYKWAAGEVSGLEVGATPSLAL